MRFTRRLGTSENPSQQPQNLVKEFLSCQHLLSDEEILEFLSSGGESENEGNDGTKDINERVKETWTRHHHDSCDEHFHLRQAFHRRTAEIRKLSANLRQGLGGARIDEDGRLVPSTEPPQPPRADLPPLGNDPNVNVGVNNDNPNANDNANDNPQFFPGNNNHLNQQQENLEELFLEQRRCETEFAIAHAVRELRRSNQPEGPVPEEDFEVIRLDQRGRPRVVARHGGFFDAAPENDMGDENNNDETTILTNPALRRIAFGCFTMVALIICIMVKVLPIGSMFTAEESVNKNFDPLLNKVLVVREWKDHVHECSGGLQNRSQSDYDSKWEWLHRIQRSVLYGNTTTDCSDGVLHIPSKSVLHSDYMTSSMEQQDDLSDYQGGVNLSWFMPCSRQSTESSRQQCDLQEMNGKQHPDSLDDDGQSDHPNSCPIERSFDRCFRGIHDNFAEFREIRAALAMGDRFIEIGADHFDVHYDVSILKRMLPSTVKKIRNLLETTYLNENQQSQHARNSEGEKSKNGRKGCSAKKWDVRPVAFRVLTTGPMDGHDVKLKQDKGDKMTMYLAHSAALNEPGYLNWVLESRRHNDKALYQSYYRPWPYRLAPKRETCDLKFDLEADSRFCIHTSLFLTNGAGEDYWGGTNLFVDDHPSNFENPSRRIARGVSIDGSKGRLVVSTGGFENLRCRFPTRAGFRTVLQIWWDC